MIGPVPLRIVPAGLDLYGTVIGASRKNEALVLRFGMAGVNFDRTFNMMASAKFPSPGAPRRGAADRGSPPVADNNYSNLRSVGASPSGHRVSRPMWDRISAAPLIELAGGHLPTVMLCNRLMSTGPMPVQCR